MCGASSMANHIFLLGTHFCKSETCVLHFKYGVVAKTVCTAQRGDYSAVCASDQA